MKKSIKMVLLSDHLQLGKKDDEIEVYADSQAQYFSDKEIARYADKPAPEEEPKDEKQNLKPIKQKNNEKNT